MAVLFYTTDAGRSAPLDALATLAPQLRAAVLADLALLGQLADKAPLSMRHIVGHRPMWEVRTGAYRTFFVRITGGDYIVLGVCKKQDQRREIAAASARMKLLLEE